MIGSILVDKKPLVTVGPDATVSQIAALLHEHRIGAVLVMEGDSIAGLVSERDICRCLHVHGVAVHDARARDIMTAPVVVTDPRASV
jgi:CBS domain-containing protein